MTKRIGYIRVSKDEQNPARQIDGLQAVCDELRIEQGVSAAAKSRPVFEQTLAELKEGDTFTVWDLDRAFRSTVDAVMTADALRARGVHFQIVTLAVDTATPAGKLVYTVMAAQAEFERSNLIKRTKEGMKAAKRRGVHVGRPRALSREQTKHAKTLLNEGRTAVEIAGIFGVHEKTIRRLG